MNSLVIETVANSSQVMGNAVAGTWVQGTGQEHPEECISADLVALAA